MDISETKINCKNINCIFNISHKDGSTCLLKVIELNESGECDRGPKNKEDSAGGKLEEI